MPVRVRFVLAAGALRDIDVGAGGPAFASCVWASAAAWRFAPALTELTTEVAQ
jgi:hypothetical protein